MSSKDEIVLELYEKTLDSLEDEGEIAELYKQTLKQLRGEGQKQEHNKEAIESLTETVEDVKDVVRDIHERVEHLESRVNELEDDEIQDIIDEVQDLEEKSKQTEEKEKAINVPDDQSEEVPEHWGDDGRITRFGTSPEPVEDAEYGFTHDIDSEDITERQWQVLRALDKGITVKSEIRNYWDIQLMAFPMQQINGMVRDGVLDPSRLPHNIEKDVKDAAKEEYGKDEEDFDTEDVGDNVYVCSICGQSGWTDSRGFAGHLIHVHDKRNEDHEGKITDIYNVNSESEEEESEEDGVFDADGNLSIDKNKNIMQYDKDVRGEMIEKYFEEESDVALTLLEIGDEVFDSNIETQTPEYSSIYDVINSAKTDIQSSKIDGSKYYYTDEQQFVNRKLKEAKRSVVDDLGKNEYEIRRLAINKNLPEKGERGLITFDDFSSVYGGSEDYTAHDAWQEICDNSDFRNAIKYDFNEDIEFSLGYQGKTSDNERRYALEVERPE